MDEGQTVTFQLLQDEALTPEEPGSQFLLERDTDGDSLGRAKESILLAEDHAAVA